jgi:circadian clock protein KaiB
MPKAENTELDNSDTTLNYKLRMYVTGASPNSARAISNIKNICETHLSGMYDLEIIDVYQEPLKAQTEQVIALPMLVKSLPLPFKRLIGDMSDTKKVLKALGLE